jgi:hypothetical protein
VKPPFDFVLGVDPAKTGAVGLAAVSLLGTPVLCESVKTIADVRKYISRTYFFGEADRVLVAIERPLIFVRGRAPVGIDLAIAAGQVVEMAERVRYAWMLVNVATWKGGRGIAPNTPSAQAKAASIRLALATWPIGGAPKKISADAADALNLAIYAAGALRLGAL